MPSVDEVTPTTHDLLTLISIQYAQLIEQNAIQIAQNEVIIKQNEELKLKKSSEQPDNNKDKKINDLHRLLFTTPTEEVALSKEDKKAQIRAALYADKKSK